ncbi:YhbY family RNA-binding protein [Treponema sp.]|uniref:YhbY family RNA-binding protein n=1 Tax=Treponema sp. TaxID=166 RepID=UPI0025CE3E6E|nr:YhbY family RNA-binding protein [Treponema sp.]
MELNSKQRKVLTALSNPLEPLVIVGAGGVTEGLEKKTLECLEHHELIKVKFNEFKEEKLELSQKLADSCEAALVRVIGNVAILYKQNPDPEKRVIKLK